MGVSETAKDRLTENIASVIFGWCCALILVSSTRIYSSWAAGRKSTTRHSYFVLCTALVLVSALLAGVAWAYLIRDAPNDVITIGMSLLLWSVQIHIYFHLVMNRICLLGLKNSNPRILRGSITVLTLLANIAMFCFWLLPQITQTTTWTAPWFPRMEKVLYIIIDMTLHFTFILRVRNRLMRAGLEKYKKLIHYNIQVIILSLLCDSLLLGMQWFPACSSMFIMVHPLVFLNKLMLEMSTCENMARISRETNIMKALSDYMPSPKYQEFEDSYKGDARDSLASTLTGSSDSLEYEEFIEAAKMKVTVRAIEDKVLPQLPATTTSTTTSPTFVLPLAYRSQLASTRSKLSYYGVSV